MISISLLQRWVRRVSVQEIKSNTSWKKQSSKPVRSGDKKNKSQGADDNNTYDNSASLTEKKKSGKETKPAVKIYVDLQDDLSSISSVDRFCNDKNIANNKKQLYVPFF